MIDANSLQRVEYWYKFHAKEFFSLHNNRNQGARQSELQIRNGLFHIRQHGRAILAVQSPLIP